MRKLLIYSLLALFTLTLGSCSKDEVFYEFGEGEIGATFQASTLIYDDISEADNGKISVPLYRSNTKGAVSVPVEITGGEGTYTPSSSSFSFADGESVAYIDFTFNYETLSGKPVTISIAISNESDCAEKGESETTFTLTRKLTWEKVGTGIYYTAFFDQQWEQDLYKAKEGNFYMLKGCWYAGTDFTFFYDGTTVDWYASKTGYYYGSYGPVVFDVISANVTTVSGSPAIKIDCNYRLPQYYNYNLGKGYEIFVFPKGTNSVGLVWK